MNQEIRFNARSFGDKVYRPVKIDPLSNSEARENPELRDYLKDLDKLDAELLAKKPELLFLIK